MPEHADSKTVERAGAPTAPAGVSPKKPSSPTDPINKTRRQFFWTCLYGYLGVNFLMFLRYFLPRALFEPPAVFSIGFASDYGLGVDLRFLQAYRVWVVREPGRLFVIFAQCTHLGCTPDWEQAQNIFHCPCHGSEYDSEGINFAGPAPRPMNRCQVTLDPSGAITVDTSVQFINDPAAGTNQFNEAGSYVNA